MELYKNKEWLAEKLISIGYKDEIGRLAGCSGDTIEYWRKKFNLPPVKARPPKSKKYSFNKDYFSNVTTEEQAYWLGFLMADGCLSSSKKCGKPNTLDIVLNYEDKSHLEKFIKAIEGNMPIKVTDVYDKRGFVTQRSELKIHSTDLCGILLEWGIVPRKTGLENIPDKLNKTLYIPFIRGFFDGDGCICKTPNKKYYRLHVGSSSKEIITKIQTFLRFYDVQINMYVTNKYKRPFYYLESTCKTTCCKFYHLLYDDAKIYLDRKMMLVLDMFKICPLK